MIPFIDQARTYAAYHQKPETMYTHMAGVPIIIFSLMVFLGFFHIVVPGVFDIDFALIATIALLVYYFVLNWRLALALTPLLIFLLWIANLVSEPGPNAFALWVFIITFVIGWALQLLGHFIEDKHPAFVDNLWQGLIAPLALVAEVFFMAGFMDDLKEEIYGRKVVGEEEKPVAKPKAKIKK